MPLGGNKSQSELNRTLRELIARQTAIDKRVERLETLESANVETVWNILEDTNWIGFNGLEFPLCTTTYINCGSDPILDNLPSANEGKGILTIDYWIMVSDFDKGDSTKGTTMWGWADPPNFGAGTRGTLGTSTTIPRNYVEVACIQGKGKARGTTSLVTNVWYHLALTYDDTDDRVWHIYINGTEEAYSISTPAVGVILGDAAGEFLIGLNEVPCTGNCFPVRGRFGWFRISDNIRWTANFAVPPRCELPAIDGNTLAQWIGTEADPIVTVDNQEGTAALDGTPFNCTWGQCV